MEFLSSGVETQFVKWYAAQQSMIDILGLLGSLGIWLSSVSAKRVAVVPEWNVRLRMAFIAATATLIFLFFWWNKLYLRIRERSFILLWLVGMVVISTGDTFIVPAVQDKHTNDIKVFRMVVVSKWPMILWFFFGLRLRVSCVTFAHFPGLMFFHLFSTSAYNEEGLDHNVYVQALTGRINRLLDWANPLLMWPELEPTAGVTHLVSERQAVTILWAFTHAIAFWSAFCWLVHSERALRRAFIAQHPTMRAILVDDTRGLAGIMAAAEFFMLLHCQPLNVGPKSAVNATMSI